MAAEASLGSAEEEARGSIGLHLTVLAAMLPLRIETAERIVFRILLARKQALHCQEGAEVRSAKEKHNCREFERRERGKRFRSSLLLKKVLSVRFQFSVFLSAAATSPRPEPQQVPPHPQDPPHRQRNPFNRFSTLAAASSAQNHANGR